MALRSNNKIKIEGGMSSMTDLVFLLLIFFIIMSIMSNDTTPLALPNPDDVDLPKNPEKTDPSVIVTEDNRYVVMPGGDMNAPMEFEEIKDLTFNVVMNSKKPSLKIAGHKNADYEAVFKVLALCQANEWEPVLAYDR